MSISKKAMHNLNVEFMTMRDLLDARTKHQQQIHEAKIALRNIECNIKKQLISDKDYDLLSVNWTRLNRSYK